MMTTYPDFYAEDGLDNSCPTEHSYTPAAVIKSNSLTSNDCTRSSFDGQTSANSVQPLKLVFKRHANNKYEIKNHNELILDENNNQLSNDGWSTASDLTAENELSNRRPMRQSARKVKFTFSDAEEDIESDFLPPTSKKKRYNKQENKSSIKSAAEKTLKNSNTNIQNFNPQFIIPQLFSQNHNLNESDESTDGNEDDDDTENSLRIYQELLLKNMPQAQILSIQNMVLQNQLQNQNLLNAKILAQETEAAAEEKQLRKKRSRIFKEDFGQVFKQKITKKKRRNSRKTNYRKMPAANNQVMPLLTPQTSTPIKKFRQAPDHIILQSDIIKASFLEKHEILKQKISVVLYHSQGIPIALVENNTNFIQTKAVLFLHLFVSLSVGCIWCPLCATHLSVTEFSRHVHPEEGEDDEEDQPSEDSEFKAKKTYKILPYRIDGQELSSDVLVGWKTFARRFSEFKQAQINKASSAVVSQVMVKKNQEINEHASILKAENKNIPNESNTSSSLPVTLPLSPRSLQNVEKFNDWDYEHNERFFISGDRLATDKVFEIETEKLDEEIHYFMEQQEDLLLSEDESDDIFEMNEDLGNRLVQISNTGSTLNCFIPETKNKSNDAIEPLLTNMVNHVVDSLQTSSFQKVKNNLRTKRLSYDESSVKMSCAKPPLLERYFNLYENLSNDVILYICSNEFTVIPDSYVMYINSKRATFAKELKMSRSIEYQREWLLLSLDLEYCNKNKSY